MIDIFLRSFLDAKHLLGRPPQQPLSIVTQEMKRVRMSAKYLYHSGDDLEAGQLAKENIRNIILFFFETVEMIISPEHPHPLARVNKCMGMAAIPNSSLVLVAISEDAQNDEPLPVRFTNFSNVSTALNIDIPLSLFVFQQLSNI